jgi:hypothetical protein
MTFGGSPCPALWGVISKTTADLSNAIIQNKYWNFHDVYDPLSDNLEPPLSLPNTIPFHPAKELSVSLPENNLGKVDIYIDDSIGITPNLPNNSYHISRAIPLEIRTIANPLDPSDIIPRADIIFLKKFKAEGGKIPKNFSTSSKTLQMA